MRIELQWHNEASPRLRRLRHTRLPAMRREAVEETFRELLSETIRLNPVQTARSRAAWVAALEQVGGTPPAGWQGPQPTGESEGRRLGVLRRHHEADVTDLAATNGVRYVPFLEYGTRRMAPFGMVRRALSRARRLLLEQLRRSWRSS
jgi:hypothetical protein